MSPQARQTEAKFFLKMVLHQTKKLCTVKETINKMKKQLNEWVKRFASDVSNKGLISKICKELIKFNTKKPQTN